MFGGMGLGQMGGLGRLGQPVLGRRGDISAAYSLYLPFKNGGNYRAGSSTASAVTGLPGYAYTGAGASGEVSQGSVTMFAAHVPKIISGAGIWLRATASSILPRSQEFDNASWTKTGGAIAANAAAAPDGSMTADRLTSSGSVETAVWLGASVTSGAVYTTSCFMERGDGHGYIQINASSTAWVVFFDLTNGTVGPSVTLLGTAPAHTGYIVDLGGGKYRCIVVSNAPTTVHNPYFGVCSAVGNRSGAAGKHVYLWQAQMLAGNYPSGGPIIATTTGTASIDAASLKVGMANGNYSVTYTFDDGSTQTIPTTVAGGLFTLPVSPTALNRSLVQLVTAVPA